MKFDMSEGFPLLTSKKMYVRGIFQELIWFLKGDTNIKYLVDNDVHIWNGDAIKNYEKHNGEINWGPFITKEEVFVDMIKNDRKFAEKWGELGPVYGKQWRNWSVSSEYSDGVYYSKDQNIDQIANLIKDLKTNPDSRRLMVSAWNVGELDQMVLPPCHYGFQCYTQVMNKEERIKYFCDSLEKHISYGEDFTMDRLDELNVPKRKISLKWTQRSCDVPLGIPYNIASYGLLLHLLSRETNMVPNELIFSGGDCHIYLNQVDGVEEQLRNKTFSLPKLKLTNTSIDELKYEDIQVVDYKSSPTVKFPLSN
jgi:thymidylate synthase